MFRNKVTSLLLLLFGFNAINAFSIKGNIKDSKQEGIENVSVILYQLKDSSLAKIALTDSLGQFEMTGINSGLFYISAFGGGYFKYFTEAIELNGDLVLPSILLKESNKNLKEVEVVSRKPFIENKPGKIILNVDAAISNAGKTAFEILEHSPNITIDQNNNIRMRGRQGVIVMIDGKPTPMSNEDLANYLKSIPAQMIERIEIITNASAKYDASGTAGIVNIVMKKDKRIGLNGTITLGAGQGRYYKTNDGLSFNYRNNKINIYGSYNLNIRKGFNDLDLYRKFYAADTLQGAYKQFNGLIFPFQSHLLRFGFDYSLTPKTTLGFTISGSSTKFNPFGQNTTKVYDQNEQQISNFSTINHSKDLWNNGAANLNLKHTLDSTGTEFTVDLDYALYGNKTTQNFTTDYTDLLGHQLQNTYLLYGDIKGQLSIYSAKTDWSFPMNKDTKLEAGLKSSYVTADNDLKFYNRSDGNSIFDSSKSNHFIYSENINSAYANFTKTLGEVNLQLGLRAEQTIGKGKQIITGNSFKNSYIQLFPNISIDKNFTPKYNAGISLSRRIERPSYDQLNPFKFFLDPTTYKEGNPYLLPQFSYNAEFTQTFNQKIMLTLGYSVTNRLITEVLVPAENSNNITVQTNVNLNRYDYYGLSISAPIQVTKFWNSVNNANAYYGYYRGNLANTNLSNGSPAFDLNSVNNFQLKNNWSAELNFFYSSGQVYAFIKTLDTWQGGVAIQKSFHERRGTIKLSLNDLFWSFRAAGETKFKNYDEVFFVKRETRFAMLTFTYKLGKTNLPSSRRRTGGAEEEKRRASKGGN